MDESKLETLKNNILNSKLEFDKLKKDKKVMRFLSLSSYLYNAKEELVKLKLDVETNKMKTCNHILVINGYITDNDPHKGNSYETAYECIKCGLDGRIQEEYAHLYSDLERRMLSIYQSYYWNNAFSTFNRINVYFRNFDLAKFIYQRILSTYKELSKNTKVSDNIISKYFESIYDSIESEYKKDDFNAEDSIKIIKKIMDL